MYRVDLDQPVTRAWPERRRTSYHLLAERQRAEQSRSADAERFVDLAGSLLELGEQIASSYATTTRETFLERATAVRGLAEELVDLAGRME